MKDQKKQKIKESEPAVSSPVCYAHSPELRKEFCDSEKTSQPKKKPGV